MSITESQYVVKTDRVIKEQKYIWLNDLLMIEEKECYYITVPCIKRLESFGYYTHGLQWNFLKLTINGTREGLLSEDFVKPRETKQQRLPYFPVWAQALKRAPGQKRTLWSPALRKMSLKWAPGHRNFEINAGTLIRGNTVLEDKMKTVVNFKRLHWSTTSMFLICLL